LKEEEMLETKEDEEEEKGKKKKKKRREEEKRKDEDRRWYVWKSKNILTNAFVHCALARSRPYIPMYRSRQYFYSAKKNVQSCAPPSGKPRVVGNRSWGLSCSRLGSDRYQRTPCRGDVCVQL
jgi:hypothetical protein